LISVKDEVEEFADDNNHVGAPARDHYPILTLQTGCTQRFLTLSYSLNATTVKFDTTLPSGLKPYFKQELEAYHKTLHQENYTLAWHHLERAHVIGQAYPLAHSYVHWKMLLFGIKIKSIEEITGQLPRLLVGGIKSFVGKIPIGNTGGSNIPPLQSLPLSEDIKTIFAHAGLENYGA
jgi:hypothetical protein